MDENITIGRRGALGPILVAALLLASVVALFAVSPAQAASAGCGHVVRTDFTLDNDLVDCRTGLVIGANGITVDLNGHTIDGTGLGAGIRNNGFDDVRITNNSGIPAFVQEFDYGVMLNAGTLRNTVEKLTIQHNQFAGMRLLDADRNQITSNTLDFQSVDGLHVLNGSTGNVAFDNKINNSGGRGVLVERSSNNQFNSNRLTRNSDGGIHLQLGSNANKMTGNTLLGLAQGDAGISISESHNNRVEGSTITKFSDAGLKVTNSNGSQILTNTIRSSNDGAILLQFSNNSTIKGNIVRLSATGIELNTSAGNLLESNNVSNGTGIGIELEGSPNNDLVLNTANANGADGIHVAGETTIANGNLLDRNTANDNLSDGIVVASGGHTITANNAHNNGGWGIYAAPGNRTSGNHASGNAEPAQCFGLSCRP